MPVDGSFHGLNLCSGCLQNEVGRRFVTSDGQGSLGIMLLGESPWEDEVRQGKPFAGAAGSLLDSQLRRAALNRTNVIISNVMWCKPPYLGWVGKHPDSAIALNLCRYWERLIELHRPKVIVTLGEIAMQQVLGISGLDNHQSYIHDSRFGVPVIPTYHPAHILRGNHRLTQALFFAISRAKEVAAADGKWQRKTVNYLIDPSEGEARDYLFDGWQSNNGQVSVGGGEFSNSPDAGAKTSTETVAVSNGAAQWLTRPWPASKPAPAIPLLVVDLETPNSSKLDEADEAEQDPSYTIVRLGLSVAEGTALTVPWKEPYIALVKRAVAAAAVMVVWNGAGFDLPRMQANEMRWNGEVHDGMWMWHFLQSDMLKGLGFVAPFFTDMPAWKHLSDSDLPYYTACDGDAEFRCYVGIRRALEQAGRWQRFVRHCIRAGELFRLPHVGRIYLDADKQAILKTRLIAERDEALGILQTMVPTEVKPRKPYKRKPADYDGNPERYQLVTKPCPCRLSSSEQAELFNDVEVE